VEVIIREKRKTAYSNVQSLFVARASMVLPRALHHGPLLYVSSTVSLFVVFGPKISENIPRCTRNWWQHFRTEMSKVKVTGVYRNFESA